MAQRQSFKPQKSLALRAQQTAQQNPFLRRCVAVSLLRRDRTQQRAQQPGATRDGRLRHFCRIAINLPVEALLGIRGRKNRVRLSSPATFRPRLSLGLAPRWPVRPGPLPEATIGRPRSRSASTNAGRIAAAFQRQPIAVGSPKVTWRNNRIKVRLGA